MLRSFTAGTHATYERLLEDPAAAAHLELTSDLSAIHADNDFRVELPGAHNEAYLELFDSSPVASSSLFKRPAEYSDGTQTSFALSRYQQLNLELEHVSAALARAKDKGGLAQLNGSREVLFDRAQEYLSTLADPTRVSAENLRGFKYTYEKLTFDHSPLRFETWKRAASQSDGKIYVWRGDKAFTKLTGVFADSIPFRPDSRALAKERDAQSGTANLFNELAAVGSSSMGTG